MTHQIFETFIILVICTNAVWIGVDLDHSTDDNKDEFYAVECIFVVIFLFELFARFMSYHQKSDFFTDVAMRGWNAFDGVLVLLMVIENFVLKYAMRDVSAEQLSMLSSMRLLRLLRITRIFYLVPELGMMVKSLFAAARSVTSTLILLFGIMYIFAIVLTQWVKNFGVKGKCVMDDVYGNVCFGPYFGTLGWSLVSLMQIIVYDDTYMVIRPAMKETKFVGMLLIVYMLLAAFTVLNMLIGVICDIVSETTTKEKDNLLRARMHDLFDQIDVDGSGTVTRQEFENQDTMSQISKLGIDKELLMNAFDIIDTDDSNCLDAQEFIQMIFTLIHAPTSQDILAIHSRIDRLADTLGMRQPKDGRRSSGSSGSKPTLPSDRTQQRLGGVSQRLAGIEKRLGVTPAASPSLPQLKRMSTTVPGIDILAPGLDALTAQLKVLGEDKGVRQLDGAQATAGEPPIQEMIQQVREKVAAISKRIQ